MSDEFDLWLRACEEFNTLPYLLEGEGRTGLYVTRRTYEPTVKSRWNYTYSNFTWHVWIRGKHKVTTNRDAAYALWRHRNDEM